MATIGNVQTVYLITMDNQYNRYETNVSKGFQVNPEATYQNVDDAMRALNALSTNTYQDTTLITAVSVNEKVSEEEG